MNWKIIDEKTIIKQCDDTFYKYKTSIVPNNSASFWGVEGLSGRIKDITIFYNGKPYDAVITTNESGRELIRLRWRSNLHKELVAFANEEESYAKYVKKSEDEFYLTMLRSIEPSSVEEKISHEKAEYNSWQRSIILLIKEEPNYPLLCQMRELQGISEEAFHSFIDRIRKSTIWKSEPQKESISISECLSFIWKNVVLDSRAVEKFLDFQKGKGMNEKQCGYTKRLLYIISENCDIGRQDLIEQKLCSTGLFDSMSARSLATDIANVFWRLHL